MDIAGPKNSAVECKKFEKYVQEFKDGAETLTKALVGIPGAWVENNHLSLSVHYRASVTEDIPKVESIVDDFIASDEGKNMRKSQGKMVFELKLDTNWNKGTKIIVVIDVERSEASRNRLNWFASVCRGSAHVYIGSSWLG